MMNFFPGRNITIKSTYWWWWSYKKGGGGAFFLCWVRDEWARHICIKYNVLTLCWMLDSVVSRPEWVENALEQASSIAAESFGGSWRGWARLGSPAPFTYFLTQADAPQPRFRQLTNPMLGTGCLPCCCRIVLNFASLSFCMNARSDAFSSVWSTTYCI